MIKTLLTVSISLAMLASADLVYAQGEASGGKAKAATCTGCHGEDGNSMMPGFPKLAGQHKAYLIKQLQDFKSGSRLSPLMAPLATGLDEKSIEEIAEYYSANKISANPVLVLPASDEDDEAPAKTEEQKKAELAKLIAQGSNLYRNGDIATAVSACIACHGPFGEGNRPAAFPALHSQHADYLIKTLTDFKTGARSKSRENMMHMIATKMTDQEIKAVAYYIASMK
jgi:cytochrome c553